jgi:hypothetical protein
VDVVKQKSTFLVFEAWGLIPAQKERRERKMKGGKRK